MINQFQLKYPNSIYADDISHLTDCLIDKALGSIFATQMLYYQDLITDNIYYQETHNITLQISGKFYEVRNYCVNSLDNQSIEFREVKFMTESESNREFSYDSLCPYITQRIIIVDDFESGEFSTFTNIGYIYQPSTGKGCGFFVEINGYEYMYFIYQKTSKKPEISWFNIRTLAELPKDFQVASHRKS